MTVRELLVKLLAVSDLDTPIGWLAEDAEDIDDITSVEEDEENEMVVLG